MKFVILSDLKNLHIMIMYRHSSMCSHINRMYNGGTLTVCACAILLECVHALAFGGCLLESGVDCGGFCQLVSSLSFLYKEQGLPHVKRLSLKLQTRKFLPFRINKRIRILFRRRRLLFVDEAFAV